MNHSAHTEYAIGLVLYHPEERLLKRLDLMIELGFRVYMFDNSPFETSHNYRIQKDKGIVYLTAGKNVGIGYSLSTLCATAYSHGYERLLFLDQDTGISAETLEFIEDFQRCVSHEFTNQYAALVFNGRAGKDQTIEEVRFAISSGSLFNLTALKKIGWHNESYFVDCVDYEFCVRARYHGFKIGSVKGAPDFDHISEQPDRPFKIFGKLILVRRYSATRINDALTAYSKLIIGGFFRNKLGDTFALVKSMIIYILIQVVARLTNGRR